LLLCVQRVLAMFAGRAAQLGLLHRTVTWHGRTGDFARAVTAAAGELRALAGNGDSKSHGAGAAQGREAAVARLQHWTALLSRLAAPATR
jgi:hypothetical protein